MGELSLTEWRVTFIKLAIKAYLAALKKYTLKNSPLLFATAHNDLGNFYSSLAEIENKVEKILEFAELEKFSQLKLKYFSSGMKARLAFSTAMQINPDILLVDEILTVGDKDFQKKSYETFVSLAKDKKTVLHASHNLARLSEFSDRILLLHKGRKVMLGSPDEVIDKYKTLKSSN